MTPNLGRGDGRETSKQAINGRLCGPFVTCTCACTCSWTLALTLPMPDGWWSMADGLPMVEAAVDRDCPTASQHRRRLLITSPSTRARTATGRVCALRLPLPGRSTEGLTTRATRLGY